MTYLSWITVQQAAEELQVSTKTIRRMISRGELEAKRVGPRLIRIRSLGEQTIGRELVW